MSYELYQVTINHVKTGVEKGAVVLSHERDPKVFIQGMLDVYGKRIVEVKHNNEVIYGSRKGD